MPQRVPMPEFEAPPVIETVLAVHFKPPPGFAEPHMGLYWSGVRDAFPRAETRPPLLRDIEQFKQPAVALQPHLVVSGRPQARFWLTDEKETILLQVQSDRFIQNWRRRGEKGYPRYHVLRDQFEKRWKHFTEFLGSAGFKAPDVLECEVTYLNHIDRERGWREMADLADVLGLVRAPPTGSFLPKPEFLSVVYHYANVHDRVRLRVAAEPVLAEDQRLTLQLNLTARGSPASSRIDDIMRWLDVGHEWVVRGFADLTTPRMHGLWQRRV